MKLKPFSVPSMSVSMSGRKTRRGKGSSRSAGDFVVQGGGSGGSVRPTVYKQNDMNSQIEINDQNVLVSTRKIGGRNSERR